MAKHRPPVRGKKPHQNRASAHKHPAHKPKRSPAEISARNRRVVWSAGIALAVCVVLFFPVALATDVPAFCKSCHGMAPFYDAWHQSRHKDFWCVDCHVGPGYPNRFAHKFLDLQEVYAQFFTHATFPNYNADVPDSRCLRCHQDVPTKAAAPGAFSHQLHLGKGVSCAKCHATVGHQVAYTALQSAGVLNTFNVAANATYVGQELVGTPGTHSVLAGHKPVACSDCHDMANQQCSFCHTPPPSHFGADCKLCHRPGVPFAQFTHPPSGQHSYLSRPCVKCHPNGYTTVFCTCHNGTPPQGGE